jgi:pimeloyl-ACP methyl ester carboxylesterase
MSLPGDYRRNGMRHEEIDGVPIWYEEHGDPAGPPLVALHGGIVTFQGTFGDVLPWLTEGRRVIGVELQGHGHTPDTGRAMSIERFADDVAELIDRVAAAGPSTCGASASGPSPPRASPSATRPRSAASC